jgi:hypothetical protein
MRLLLCTLIIIASNLRAQFPDSLKVVLRGKYSVDARLESRYSFADNQLISVSGARLGLDFQRRLRLGGGISWLNSPFTQEFQRTEGEEVIMETKYLKFVYLCYYADVVFHKTKRWQLSVPIQAGTGLSWFQDEHEYHWGNKSRKHFLLLYEPGITVQFKIFTWAGLGTDVAYRFTLKNNKAIGSKLSSPTYSFKLLFWPDQLFYELFPESKLTKRFGPSYW